MVTVMGAPRGERGTILIEVRTTTNYGFPGSRDLLLGAGPSRMVSARAPPSSLASGLGYDGAARPDSPKFG